MKKIINLAEFKKKNLDPEKMDLDDFLKHFNSLCERKNLSKDGVVRVGSEKLKEEFEKVILDELMRQKLINPAFFRCGLYVSKLLAGTMNKIPKSWFVVDYLDDNFNGRDLQDAADLCFLISSVFQGRGNVKCMNLKDYQNMGASMYYMFYSVTGKYIGFEMSKKFKPMVNLTIKSLKYF